MKLKRFIKLCKDHNDEVRDSGEGSFIDIFANKDDIHYLIAIQDSVEAEPTMYCTFKTLFESELFDFTPGEYLVDDVHDMLKAMEHAAWKVKKHT